VRYLAKQKGRSIFTLYDVQEHIDFEIIKKFAVAESVIRGNKVDTKFWDILTINSVLRYAKRVRDAYEQELMEKHGPYCIVYLDNIPTNIYDYIVVCEISPLYWKEVKKQLRKLNSGLYSVMQRGEVIGNLFSLYY